MALLDLRLDAVVRQAVDQLCWRMKEPRFHVDAFNLSVEPVMDAGQEILRAV